MNHEQFCWWLAGYLNAITGPGGKEDGNPRIVAIQRQLSAALTTVGIDWGAGASKTIVGPLVCAPSPSDPMFVQGQFPPHSATERVDSTRLQQLAGFNNQQAREQFEKDKARADALNRHYSADEIANMNKNTPRGGR